MNEDSVFQPGRSVRLTWIAGDTEFSVASRIAQSDINSVYLYAPSGEASTPPPQRRAEASLFVSLDEGEAEYATIFEGVELETTASPLWVVRYPQIRVTSIRRRRHYYRISYSEPIYFELLRDQKTIPIEYPHQGEMVNLSSGGVRAFVPLELGTGDQVEAMFAIPPYRMILKASVVMARTLPPGGRFQSEAAMRFLALEAKQRDRISRFIMQEQAKRNIVGR